MDEDDFRQRDADPDGRHDGREGAGGRDSDNDRNGTSITVEKAVTLKLANTIAVELEGPPGSTITVSIIGVDNDPPTISAVASPAANAAGWNNTNVVVTFTCSDKTSGVASCPSPVTISREGANQVVSGTATDLAGNSASASVTINLDKTAPTIAAAPAPPANGFGWNKTAVTVGFNCADGLSGVAFCAPATILNNEGANQAVNGLATDKAGNSASTSASVNIDKTPPLISSTVTPNPNAAGWNNTNVSVAFTCSDSLSGVASCPATATVSPEGANQNVSGAASDKAGNTASTSRSLNIDKTPPVITTSLTPAANSFGWNNTSVTVNFACTDALSGVASCPSPSTFTKEGTGQAALGNATDVAGNSSSATATVNIDETPPTIAASVSPAPNAAGWNNTNVVVSFTCADSGSGIASCPQQQLVSAEGANQSILGTATDKAGNNANASVTVKIDRTPPVITAVISPTPNSANWNNTDVTVSFTCSDAGSGVAICPAPIHVTAEGANQVFTGSATDIAGNTATTSVTLNIDKTSPVITASAAPQPNANQWNNSAVTVTFQCSDTLSGIANCPGTQTISTEGANQIISGVATDVAGNPASTSVTINLETSAPHITVSGAPTANAAGWNNTDVTITFQCSPAVAPITSCPGSQTVSNEGANQSFSGTVTDAADNKATTSIALNVDKTPPVIAASVSPTPGPNGLINATTATVSFTCSDSLSGVLSCPSDITVTTTGPQNISGTATDVAGNTASTSIQFNLQPFPPLKITASASLAPNAAGWNNSPVTVTFVCTGGAPPVSCPAPQTVSVDGANQVISGTVTDSLGNTATASVTVNLDRSPPLLAVTSPADGSVNPSATVTVSGLVSDGLSGVAAVSCNGTPATLSSGSFNCAVQITQGSLLLSVQATDVAGNTASTSLGISLQGPRLTIASPAALDLFSSSTITVTGTVDDPNAVVTVNGVQATSKGGTFTANGVILREGNNLVTAAGTNAGGAAGTASVNVVLDTTPPTVLIDSPSDKAILTTPEIMVTGLVNDIVTGTVNNPQVTVTINGVKADVGNRSFMAHGVLLVPGQNVITAVAKDKAGNISQSQVTVTLQDAATQQRILMVSGNGQSGPIGTTLPQPLVVQVVNAAGQTVPNLPMTFAVNKSDGLISAFPQQGRQLVVQTDANGQASVSLQLGTRVGNGNNQVIVTAAGFVGEIMFGASATLGPAAQIHAISGESQKGVIGQSLPEPLVVTVSDASGNAVAGVPVVFTVTQGGGALDGSNAVTKTTDSDGRAAAVLVLAQEEGVNNNVVNATVGGLAASPASFVASGMTPRNPTGTTVSGIVLDDANQPIPNATASIRGTNLTALTGKDGQFTIANAPVGTIDLFVDGSTSTDSETYPFLEFPMVTVAGQDNHLGSPIFLPALDVENSKMVGGDQDVDLTMKGVPGLKFTVFAHSATFPDGSHVGRLLVSQVHSDKVPMPPPGATAPALMWTIQPPRVRFNPPIRVELPNTNALPAGTVTETFCYNHDLEQFVSGGTARVSEDGSVIVSDPGFGLVVSGWGGSPPPQPPKTCTSNCDDNNVCTKDSCEDGACKHAPLSGGGCDDHDKCTVNDKCQNGVCKGDPKKITSVTVKAAGMDHDVTKKTKEDIPFTVDVQQQNCGTLKYKWDFGDGKTSTEQNPTHQYKEPKKYHVTVEVTCDSQLKCSTQSGSIDVNIIGIKIELCKKQTDCDITADPMMPTIHVKATIVGMDPDPTASTTFQWNGKLMFETRDCRASRALGDPAPLMGSSVGGEFDMRFAQIRGGSLQVTAKATVNGVDLMGDTKDQDATKDLKVRGTNPNRTDIQGRAGSTDLQMIACQESGQRQFNAAADTGVSVCAVWNQHPGDGGVGVMQLTPARSANDVWNWQTNVDGGVTKFSGGDGSATRYQSHVVGSALWNKAIQGFNFQRQQQQLPPITITLRQFNANEHRLDQIRIFNGVAGTDEFHSGAGVHEFKVVTNGQVRLQDNSTAPLLVLTVNEQARTGAADWVQVQPRERTGGGDRCYVQNVLQQSPSCPAQVPSVPCP